MAKNEDRYEELLPFREMAIELMDDDVDFDDVISDIYSDEINFNNADQTSGQRVLTYAEVEEQ
jgi:predicted RNA methylase